MVIQINDPSRNRYIIVKMEKIMYYLPEGELKSKLQNQIDKEIENDKRL